MATGVDLLKMLFGSPDPREMTPYRPGRKFAESVTDPGVVRELLSVLSDPLLLGSMGLAGAFKIGGKVVPSFINKWGERGLQAAITPGQEAGRSLRALAPISGEQLVDELTPKILRPEPQPIVGKYAPGKGPTPEGMTRLYRAQPDLSHPSLEVTETPDWVRQGQELSGHTAAQGRFFTADPSHLKFYTDDIGKAAETVGVDVPTAELEKYRVSNVKPEGNVDPRRFSRDPNNEFFLPPELAANTEKSYPLQQPVAQPPLTQFLEQQALGVDPSPLGRTIQQQPWDSWLGASEKSRARTPFQLLPDEQDILDATGPPVSQAARQAGQVSQVPARGATDTTVPHPLGAGIAGELQQAGAKPVTDTGSVVIPGMSDLTAKRNPLAQRAFRLMNYLGFSKVDPMLVNDDLARATLKPGTQLTPEWNVPPGTRMLNMQNPAQKQIYDDAVAQAKQVVAKQSQAGTPEVIGSTVVPRLSDKLRAAGEAPATTMDVLGGGEVPFGEQLRYKTTPARVRSSMNEPGEDDLLAMGIKSQEGPGKIAEPISKSFEATPENPNPLKRALVTEHGMAPSESVAAQPTIAQVERLADILESKASNAEVEAFLESRPAGFTNDLLRLLIKSVEDKAELPVIGSIRSGLGRQVRARERGLATAAGQKLSQARQAVKAAAVSGSDAQLATATAQAELADIQNEIARIETGRKRLYEWMKNEYHPSTRERAEYSKEALAALRNKEKLLKLRAEAAEPGASQAKLQAEEPILQARQKRLEEMHLRSQRTKAKAAEKAAVTPERKQEIVKGKAQIKDIEEFRALTPDQQLQAAERGVRGTQDWEVEMLEKGRSPEDIKAVKLAVDEQKLDTERVIPLTSELNREVLSANEIPELGTRAPGRMSEVPENALLRRIEEQGGSEGRLAWETGADDIAAEQAARVDASRRGNSLLSRLKRPHKYRAGKVMFDAQGRSQQRFISVSDWQLRRNFAYLADATAEEQERVINHLSTELSPDIAAKVRQIVSRLEGDIGPVATATDKWSWKATKSWEGEIVGSLSGGNKPDLVHKLVQHREIFAPLFRDIKHHMVHRAEVTAAHQKSKEAATLADILATQGYSGVQSGNRAYFHGTKGVSSPNIGLRTDLGDKPAKLFAGAALPLGMGNRYRKRKQEQRQ